jgi:hypothetical protein
VEKKFAVCTDVGSFFQLFFTMEEAMCYGSKVAEDLAKAATTDPEIASLTVCVYVLSASKKVVE